MNVASPRSLLMSLAAGIALGVVIGSLYAWLADKIWVYGVGTMLFIFGVISLSMGLLGGLEPEEGWATKRRTQERRSFASQLAGSRGNIEEVSPYALAIWGVAVGGPMILLSLLAFSLAA